MSASSNTIGRRVAAELHGDALHVLAGERRELLADRRSSR
jgi:hypothetical protein